MMKPLQKLLALLLAVVLLLGSGAYAAEPQTYTEGEVTGHGDPEVWLFSTAERPAESQLRTTAEGLAFLERHEGFSAEPYGDNTQTSIGYGSSTGYAEKYGFSTERLTKEEAHQLLVCVVAELETALNRFLTANGLVLQDWQYDALISFTYNLGTGWLGGCRLSRHLAEGYTTNEFASAMGIWCHVNGAIVQGLVNRRMDEMVLFLDGTYDRSQSDLAFCTLRYAGDGVFDNDIDFYEKGKPYGGFSLVTPKKPGQKLAGWYTAGGARITEQTIVTMDLTVMPRWSDGSDTVDGYIISALTAQDSKGNVLTSIPEGSFYLSAAIEKSLDSGEATVMLVTYSEAGQMLDTWIMKSNVPPGTIYELGVWVDNEENRVGMAKAFLLSSLKEPAALCPAAELQ